MSRLEELWTVLGTDPDATLTAEFRRQTLALLEEETLRRRVRQFRPRPRFVRPLLQAAALLVAAGLGFVAAREVFRPAASRPVAAIKATTAGTERIDLSANPRLSNVSYRPVDKNGRVEIGFDVTSRQTVAGRADEPEVARLLAYMVARNAETDGEKSRAIEMVSEHYGAKSAVASPEVVGALATTLRKDDNPGVRKKAADALASFRMTPEIRAVFLESLRADKNPAVRLVAVDALAAEAKQSGDPSTIESLREKAVDPQENGFVRAKAASALKAISF
ncbi:MAG: HEAT repeat domain-containing protein, partial [Thermoanaerobaculia bacterium]